MMKNLQILFKNQDEINNFLKNMKNKGLYPTRKESISNWSKNIELSKIISNFQNCNIENENEFINYAKPVIFANIILKNYVVSNGEIIEKYIQEIKIISKELLENNKINDDFIQKNNLLKYYDFAILEKILLKNSNYYEAKFVEQIKKIKELSLLKIKNEDKIIGNETLKEYIDKLNKAYKISKQDYDEVFNNQEFYEKNYDNLSLKKQILINNISNGKNFEEILFSKKFYKIYKTDGYEIPVYFEKSSETGDNYFFNVKPVRYSELSENGINVDKDKLLKNYKDFQSFDGKLIYNFTGTSFEEQKEAKDFLEKTIAKFKTSVKIQNDLDKLNKKN